MIINNYVTGLCTYYAILFILMRALSTYKNESDVKQYARLYQQQPHRSTFIDLSTASFSLVLD